jgi:hypothetical protein
MTISARLRSVRSIPFVGITTVFTGASVGALLAVDSNNSALNAKVDTFDSGSGIVGNSWADLSGEQFAALPTGSRIVDCVPTQKRFEPGAITSGPPDFFVEHLGFHFLIDGRCSLDLNAISNPMRVDRLDPPAP